MAEDIILNGVNVDKAYEQLFDTRAKIRQEASKFMSDNIELAQSLAQQLSKCVDTDVEEIKAIANKAYNALINVQKVSDVSGVEYYLPYSSHHSLLDSYNNNSLRDLEEIEYLKDLFDELENQTNKWNASYC